MPANVRAILLAGVAVIAAPAVSAAADLLPSAPRLEAPGPVAGPDVTGWYIRGDVGIAVENNAPALKISPNPLKGLPSTAFNSFYNPTISTMPTFDVGVGYQFNNWLRMDVTGEYRGGQFQALEQVGVPSKHQQYADQYRANQSSMIGLVNGYIDVGTWYGMTPYIGAGVGMARNTLSGFTDTGFAYTGGGKGFPTGGYFSDGSKTNFAWALMTGIGFNVTQNVKLELGYRYLNYGGLTTGGSNCFNGTGVNGGFSKANCGGSANVLSTSNMLASSDFRIGLRYMISDGGPGYAPAPVYEPAPMPGPIVRKY